MADEEDFILTAFVDNVVPPVIGAAPTSLAAVSTDTIALSWTNGDTYTSTVVERKAAGADFLALHVGAGSDTSYTDSTPTFGVLYTYRVRGVKGGYPTPFSNTDTGTALPVAPSSLTDQTGTGSNTPDLSWTNNETYDFVLIEEKVGAGAFAQIDSIAGSNTSYTHNDPPLANGSYSYRIRGKVGTVFTTYSNTVTMTLPHA